MSNILFPRVGTNYQNGSPKIPLLVLLGFILIALLAVFVSGCAKKQEPTPDPTYSVTYQFSSSKIPYCVKIWDITNLNDFVDSSYSTTYSKTITYNHSETYRCDIECSSVSKMKINISTGTASISCSDSIYSTLQCFINP